MTEPDAAARQRGAGTRWPTRTRVRGARRAGGPLRPRRLGVRRPRRRRRRRVARPRAALVGRAASRCSSAPSSPAPRRVDPARRRARPPDGAPRARAGRRPAGARTLGPDDVGEMLALVELTRPGPFTVRTVELGGYVGVFDGARLVAMAGQRLAPPGSARSARCARIPTSADAASPPGSPRSSRERILERGERPFLHHAADNHPARRVYEALGFEFRREVTLESGALGPAAVSDRSSSSSFSSRWRHPTPRSVAGASTAASAAAGSPINAPMPTAERLGRRRAGVGQPCREVEVGLHVGVRRVERQRLVVGRARWRCRGSAACPYPPG